MLFKRYIAVAAALLIAAGMMAGCKKSGNESENSQISVPDNSSSVSEPVSSDESSSVSEESSTVSQVSDTAAHTHSYTEKVVEPTCTTDGYTLHECSCGKSYKDKTVSKKGHSFGEWKVTKQATTSAEGEKTRECSVCGAAETEKIAKLAYSPAGEKNEILRLVNEERAKAGLSALEYRADAQSAADIRANEIVTVFDHTRPDGSSCFTVLDGIKKTAAGENIAEYYQTPAQVMDGWMNSPGHKANILNDKFTGLAVGIAESGGKKYWVQIFVG